MTVVNLPSGNTATLLDPKKLKQKDRQKLYTNETEVTVEGAMRLQNNLMAILVTEWSFPLPVPSVKIDSLGELEIGDYDALIAATEPATKVIWPALERTVEAEADPKATTAS